MTLRNLRCWGGTFCPSVLSEPRSSEQPFGDAHWSDPEDCAVWHQAGNMAEGFGSQAALSGLVILGLPDVVP